MPLLLLAVVLVGVVRASPAGPPGFDLSGTWTSPEPSERGGTSILVRQTVRILEWKGGPRDHAWIQTFKGRLAVTGPRFSGSFRQDAPNVTKPRYGGTITGTVLDSCHLRLLAVVQQGQPTVIADFDKSPCTVATKPLRALELVLFKKRYTPLNRSLRNCPFGAECVVANGALVSICNQDDFNHFPFALETHNRFGADRGHVQLKHGMCFKKHFVNPGPYALQVKLYDEIHSQERFVVTVLPK